MVPLEFFFFISGITIWLIGLARGYHRELGNTLIILVSIFVLEFFDTQLIRLLNRLQEEAATYLGNSIDIQNLLLFVSFSSIFICIVFASYAGRTFDFPGNPAGPPIGSLLTLILGGLNGYLVSGTIWYFLDRYQYPLKALGMLQLPLTEQAQAILPYLPQKLFPSPVYWMVPVALLLILRVRG